MVWRLGDVSVLCFGEEGGGELRAPDVVLEDFVVVEECEAGGAVVAVIRTDGCEAIFCAVVHV